MADAEQNLFRPLSAATRCELEVAPGRPLGEPGKPGELHDLTSRLALACNVFDYWREDELAPVAQALAADARSSTLAFRKVLAIPGSLGNVDLDLLLAGEAARPTSVFTSYAELYERPAHDLAAALVESSEAWSSLSGCRDLARDLRANPTRFEHLPVARLLEWVVALTHRFDPRGFRLVVLWYDLGDERARRIRGELDRLRMRIGGEVDLKVLSWQRLCERLAYNGALRGAHALYIGDRYLA